MGKVTKEQKDEYEKCLFFLKSVVEISDESLKDLTDFYNQDNQTDISRMGIQFFLSLIVTEKQYTTFLRIHQELLKIWIDFRDKGGWDTQFNGPYSFFSFIPQNPIQAMELLNTADEVYRLFSSHTHVVLQHMFTLGIRVAADFDLNHTGEGKFLNFIIRRTNHLLRGFHNICKSLTLSGRQIDWGHAANMVPTDGDMHCGGRIPYQVVCKQRTWIYKPHNMRTECLITAAMQFFSSLLDKNPEEPRKLRVLDTYLLEDRTGLMEFAIYAEEMNEVQAKQYFKKLGALLCFAKLFGIKDLHYENIMATADGPVLIDLECVLDLCAIKSKTFSDMSLSDLKEAFDKKRLDNATFCVDGQIPSLSDYMEPIVQGYRTASMCCRDNKDLLVQYYRELLYRNLSVEPLFHRVVPFATKEFYNEMYNVIYCFNNSDVVRGALLGLCTNNILPPLFNICCREIQVTEEDFKASVDMNILAEIIYRDLFFGDIPIFHLKYELDAGHNVCQTGYIDNQPFFKNAICIGPLDGLANEFGAQIDWLASEEALGALQAVL